MLTHQVSMVQSLSFWRRRSIVSLKFSLYFQNYYQFAIFSTSTFTLLVQTGGRGFPAAVTIVPNEELLGVADIRAKVLTLKKLGEKTNLGWIQWLAKRRLFRNSYQCQCGTLMSFICEDRRLDGYYWKCKDCRATGSVRTGSFFYRSHLSLDQLITILYGWSRDYSQRDIAHEATLGAHSTHTIVDWCSFCREICEQHLIDHPITVGGLNEDGTSKIVEIDESKFFHRKYHRGLWRPGHWVFGGIERDTGKCFLVEVPDRSAETLSAIIERYILPGTIIVSDGWPAYNAVGAIGGGIYEYRVVIHQENFVDPDNPETHTQNIENLWMRTKRKLRHQFGTSEALFMSYMHEFIWRNKFRERNIFSEFFLSIAEQYPV